MAALVGGVGTPPCRAGAPRPMSFCAMRYQRKAWEVPENFLRTQVISHRLQIPSEWFNFVKGYSTL
jgi:hypothetical protein